VSDPRRAMSAARVAFACFVVTMLCALSLAVVYALGGQPQAEGALLGVGLLALGAGLVLWAHWLMPRGPFAQERHELASSDEEVAALERTLEHPAGVSRRRLLIGGLVGALGALGIAALFPIRSLGPGLARSRSVITCPRRREEIHWPAWRERVLRRTAGIAEW